LLQTPFTGRGGPRENEGPVRRVLKPIVWRVLEQVFPAESFERVSLLGIVWVELELPVSSGQVHCYCRVWLGVVVGEMTVFLVVDTADDLTINPDRPSDVFRNYGLRCVVVLVLELVVVFIFMYECTALTLLCCARSGRHDQASLSP
jgi:hypothetical protein